MVIFQYNQNSEEKFSNRNPELLESKIFFQEVIFMIEIIGLLYKKLKQKNLMDVKFSSPTQTHAQRLVLLRYKAYKRDCL